MNRKYDDIINLPHHVSRLRARMSNTDRGAQFSPFAALVGFDAAIDETARLTSERIELDEEKKAELNEKLCFLAEAAEAEITVTYFRPDLRKAGGDYVQAKGTVRKVDAYCRALAMTDGTVIPFENLYGIEIWTKKITPRSGAKK